MSWVGVDLDGTLAHYEQWTSPAHIGAPIPAMVNRVKALLAAGTEVRIFTARVASSTNQQDVAVAREAIAKFCVDNFGKVLPVTAEKDFAMVSLFDDRCLSVEANTGRLLSRAQPTKVPNMAEEGIFENWLTNVEDVNKLIRGKRISQLQQHGAANHELEVWASILTTEVGKLNEILLDRALAEQFDDEALVGQAIDCAACAAALAQATQKGFA